jgi:NADPH:quinone reductase-like Zn-dependent oxidoreductase
MRAVVYTEYGPPDVLQLKEVDKPAPKANELLIKVYATSVGYGDHLARNFKAISPRRFNMPWLFWLPSGQAIATRAFTAIGKVQKLHGVVNRQPFS